MELRQYVVRAQGIFGCPASFVHTATAETETYALLLYPGHSHQMNRVVAPSPAACIAAMKKEMGIE